jgi:hypothetical protein
MAVSSRINGMAILPVIAIKHAARLKSLRVAALGLGRSSRSGLLQCGISSRLLTAQGQKPRLPHRNTDGRFTSVSGHYAGDLPALPTRPGRHAAATLAPAKGRLIR